MAWFIEDEIDTRPRHRSKRTWRGAVLGSLIVILIGVVLVSCLWVAYGQRELHTVPHLTYIRMEPESESMSYSYGVFQDSTGRAYKWYILDTEVVRLTIGQTYDVTYVDKDVVWPFDHKITQIDDPQ